MTRVLCVTLCARVYGHNETKEMACEHTMNVYAAMCALVCHSVKIYLLIESVRKRHTCCLAVSVHIQKVDAATSMWAGNEWCALCSGVTADTENLCALRVDNLVRCWCSDYTSLLGILLCHFTIGCSKNKHNMAMCGMNQTTMYHKCRCHMTVYGCMQYKTGKLWLVGAN
jgi:hypothetical protein